MIVAARGRDQVGRAFPSGVSASDDRRSYLNASEAGKCTRWLWYDRNLEVTNKWLPHGIFDRGHAFELWATTYLRRARGIGRLHYAGTSQTRLMLEDCRIAGTPDGLVEWFGGDDPEVLEVKSHGAHYNYDGEPSAMHVRQTELNIELFHECTDWRPESGILLYGLAEDYYRMAVHRVERRPVVLTEAIGKANLIFSAGVAEDCPPDGIKTKQCVICPFRLTCSASLAKNMAAAGTGGLNERGLAVVDRLVAARQRAVDQSDETAMVIAETEGELMAILREAGASRIKRNGYSVALFARFRRGRFAAGNQHPFRLILRNVRAIAVR